MMWRNPNRVRVVFTLTQQDGAFALSIASFHPSYHHITLPHIFRKYTHPQNLSHSFRHSLALLQAYEATNYFVSGLRSTPTSSPDQRVTASLLACELSCSTDPVSVHKFSAGLFRVGRALQSTALTYLPIAETKGEQELQRISSEFTTAWGYSFHHHAKYSLLPTGYRISRERISGLLRDGNMWC